MIKKLKIENFRSIESAELDLGKINVLTGPNNGGKSSFIYALLGIHNFVKNSNQSIDNLFNVREQINLGGFEQIVYNKEKNKNIEIELTFEELIETSNDKVEIPETNYKLSLNPSQSFIGFKSKYPYQIELDLEISLPYIANKFITLGANKLIHYGNYIYWNGLTANRTPSSDHVFSTKFLEEEVIGTSILHIPINSLYKVDYVALKKGFFKPYYNYVPLQPEIITEDEIATSIALDRNLIASISHYTEKILDRVFSVFQTQNVGLFYLQTKNKKTSFTSDLVNEGTGTSQIIWILAKALQKNKSFICIDEPEIHLHPSIIAKLVDALVEIATEQNKQFLISTHSEHFVTTLLANVVEKKILPEDLKVYYVTKEGNSTHVEYQAVNENGQIEGGLKNFYETELENIATLFNITEP